MLPSEAVTNMTTTAMMYTTISRQNDALSITQFSWLQQQIIKIIAITSEIVEAYVLLETQQTDPSTTVEMNTEAPSKSLSINGKSLSFPASKAALAANTSGAPLPRAWTQENEAS
jgi:hypothetical protein